MNMDILLVCKRSCHCLTTSFLMFNKLFVIIRKDNIITYIPYNIKI